MKDIWKECYKGFGYDFPMEFKKTAFIWLFISNSFFRITLMNTIKYALRVHNDIRDDHAADVLTLKTLYIDRISK